MSFAAQTWTMNTANTPWIYSNGVCTELSGTSQTATFTGTDTGAGGTYKKTAEAVSTAISLLDGSKLKIELDPDFTYFKSEADGATVNNGQIWVKIDDGLREEVKITTMTVTNGDAVGADNITNITFEYPSKPYKWSWTNIDTA